MKYKLIALLGTLVLFFFVWLYTTEYHYFDNTLNIKQLLLIAASIGGGLGLLIGFTISRKDNNDTIARFQKLIICFFVGLICLPIIAAKLNRYFANDTLSYKEFKFIKQVPIISKPFGTIKNETINVSYYLVYLKDQDNETIKLKSQKEWVKTSNIMKPVLLPVKRGMLGYEIVILPENQPLDATI